MSRCEVEKMTFAPVLYGCLDGGVEHVRIVAVLERLGAHDAAKVLIKIPAALVV